jgi:hypothetical protein
MIVGSEMVQDIRRGVGGVERGFGWGGGMRRVQVHPGSDTSAQRVSTCNEMMESERQRGGGERKGIGNLDDGETQRGVRVCVRFENLVGHAGGPPSVA